MAVARKWRLNHQTGWKILKGVGIGLLVAQAAAVVTVHAVDRVRIARIPGGRHGFPTLPPSDVQIDSNVVRTYTEGESLYTDMLDAINEARESICFETYIWAADEIGRAFKDALYAAADRGVQVYIVYDGFGVLNQNPLFKIFPRHPNLFHRRIPEIRSGLFTLNLRKTGRDHRKILVTDGKYGFVGGYNIGERFGVEWRDTHVRITGPAVMELADGFAEFWNHFKRPWQPALPDGGVKDWFPPISAEFNLPSRLLFPVRGLYLDAIDRARDQILITTAYFIPDKEILHNLVAAAQRGVRVKVLIPEYSNHIMADWVARPYYGELLRNGIEIWLYQHAMIHSKTMTIDSRWSTIGTANIDRLSMQGNFEVNLQFRSTALAERMEEIFAKDLTTSRQLTLEEWERRGLPTRIIERLLHPFEWVV